MAEGDRLTRRQAAATRGDWGRWATGGFGWEPGTEARRDFLLGFLFGLLGFYCFSVVGSPGRTGWFGHEVEQV